MLMERLELLSAMLMVLSPVMVLMSLISPRGAILFRRKTRLKGVLLWLGVGLLGLLLAHAVVQPPTGGEAPLTAPESSRER